MTSYGPPGQPPGPPPPPGSFGPPAASGGAKFDPKAVNTLDWGILATGVLSLIFSFFSYYSYKGKGAEIKQVCANLDQIPSSLRGQADDACNGVTTSAWSGFFGWFGVLLALIGAGLVAMALFAPQVKLPFAVRLGALAAFALAVISTLLALLVVPDYSGTGLSGTGISYDDVVDEGHGFSYWIVLILVVVGLVLCFLRFQQTGGELPGRPGATGTPATGYGTVPPPAAQPGYPPPAAQQPGYQPPPAAQPGYQPPAPPQPQPGYQPPPPAPQGPPPGQAYPPQPQPGYQPPPQPPQGPPPPAPGYPQQ